MKTTLLRIFSLLEYGPFEVVHIRPDMGLSPVTAGDVLVAGKH